MFKKKILALVVLIIFCANISTVVTIASEKKNKAKMAQAVTDNKDTGKEELAKKNKEFQQKCREVDPLSLVKDPDSYLNQYIILSGIFDKYTTLGLDYKPAFRDSKDYISFLIRRPEPGNSKHIIPLSELKLVIPRKIAEKYTSLDTGDNIKIFGQVYSSALGDPWIEVDNITGMGKDITAPLKEDKSEGLE